MASTTERFIREGIVSDAPKFLRDAVQYETITGSMAYGCNTNNSDMDIYGFCVPPKDYVFPHLAGYVNGFDNTEPRFEQYQKHHIMEGDKETDLTIYGIVKYFKLTMENNPNMIDTLFTPRHCVLHSTAIGEHIRENRKLFLHKGSYHKFSGYSYGQLNKMTNKKPIEGSKRLPSVLKYGYDTKFAYHIVRLLNECEQILSTHDLNLTRDSEIYKSIRRGEWSKEKIQDYFDSHERSLQTCYEESTLQHSPDKGKIRLLLLECLEMAYGSLSAVIQSKGKYEEAIREITGIVGKL